MNSHELIFLVGIVIFLAILLGIAIYSLRRHSRKRGVVDGDWTKLLKRIEAVDRDNVKLVALDLIGYTQESSESTQIAATDIWDLIGGLEGLEVLEQNCAVLIDLAFYLQQWYPEALAVAESLRLNAREIEWHVSRLRAASQTGKLRNSFPDYAQRAIATYYLMTKNVLALYEKSNFPGLIELQRAL